MTKWFDGRFGRFFLYKVWLLTVIVGPILSTLRDFFQSSGARINDEFFMFILIEMVFGLVLCIPSLMISELTYKIMSKKPVSDNSVFIITLFISLVTTIITYYLFLNYPANFIDPFFYAFAGSYSICLIAGFFLFKKKPLIFTEI